MVNLVYIVGGEKHCRPIKSLEELTAACNTEENVRNWNEYRRTGEDRFKRALVQVNYNCQVPEGGLLKGVKTVSPFFFYDIDCGNREECRQIISRLLEKKDELGLVEVAESASYGVHAVARRALGRTILECQVRMSVMTRTEMDTNNKENNRVVFHGPVDAVTTPLLDEALFTESLSDEEAAAEYLRLKEDYSGTRVDLSDGERYNINLFLSNFTETGFCRNCCFDASYVDEAALTRFAIEHCWFNRQKQLEWGEYFNYNNVRLSRDQIAPVVKKYFGLDIKPSKSVDYIDYKDGWYYWEETGGHTDEGFACLTLVEKLDKRRYSVWFEIYGMGENWDNDVCYYTTAEALRDYRPYGDSPLGHAVIRVGSGGLKDRSGWALERYTMRFE